MAKVPPKYHLDECKNCSHRNVCKHIDQIDKLLKNGNLPLNLQDSACNEYLPEDIVETGWSTVIPEDRISTHEFASYADTDEDAINGVLDSISEVDVPTIISINQDEFISTMNDTISQSIKSGCDVDTIIMNRKTMQEVCTGNVKDPKTITIDVGMFNLMIDERVPYGCFAMLYKEDGNIDD